MTVWLYAAACAAAAAAAGIAVFSKRTQALKKTEPEYAKPQAVIKPISEKEKQLKYRESEAVLQPVNHEMKFDEDDGATISMVVGGMVGISGAYKGADFPLAIGECTVLGRDGEQCNLVISDREISRVHCEVTFLTPDGTYGIKDHSTNGVYLEDGSPIPADEFIKLQSGTKIRLGNTDHVFQLK